jgi:hypothetical protein
VIDDLGQYLTSKTYLSLPGMGNRPIVSQDDRFKEDLDYLISKYTADDEEHICMQINVIIVFVCSTDYVKT